MHYLTFSTNINSLLFEGWTSTNPKGLAAMCTVALLLVVTHEALQYLLLCLQSKRHKNPILYSSVKENQEREDMLQTLLTTLTLRKITKLRKMWFVSETLIHILKSLLGYLIMFMVMSYNFWLAISVFLGAGFGYFLFGSFITVLNKDLITKIQTCQISGSPKENTAVDFG